MANYRYGEYDGGPDPLAAPYDVRGALDDMGDDILGGGTPAEALRDLLRRGWQNRRGLDDLLRRVRERLAGYKAPKAVVTVDELPKTSTGKIQKNVLRDRYAGYYAGRPEA